MLYAGRSLKQRKNNKYNEKVIFIQNTGMNYWREFNGLLKKVLL